MAIRNDNDKVQHRFSRLADRVREMCTRERAIEPREKID
jgi:hypothetical protein